MEFMMMWNGLCGQMRAQPSVPNIFHRRVFYRAHRYTISGKYRRRATSKKEDSSDDSSAKSEEVSPWKLMGRVVSEKSLGFDDRVQHGLILSASARESGLPLEDFEANVERLLIIMPFLQTKILKLRPNLLAELAKNVDLTAERMISLKEALPYANIEIILSARPTLLLENEYSRWPSALRSLQEHYSDEDLAPIVEKEPLLLVEDIDKIIRELQRLVPTCGDMYAALQANPGLATQVIGLQNLSIW